MNFFNKHLYIQFLRSFIKPQRQQKIEELLAARTNWVTVALEDLFQSHNAAAVARSCDAFGIQTMSVIEGKNAVGLKPSIAQGSEKWITVSRYKDNPQATGLQQCIESLKATGYTVVGTSPHATNYLHELSVEHKTAFLFGTEKEGLSKQALELCDQLVAIEQYGFVESLNVSVSVGLCLYDFTRRLRNSTFSYGLLPQEKEDLLITCLEHSVSRPDLLKASFLKDHSDL